MSENDGLNRALVAGLDLLNKAMRPLPPLDATRKRPRGVQVLDPDKFTLTPEPEKLSDKQEAAYMAAGGTICPSCGSNDITGAQFDVGTEGFCSQRIACNTCGAEWTDEYELTGVSDFSPGVKSTTGGQTIES